MILFKRQKFCVVIKSWHICQHFAIYWHLKFLTNCFVEHQGVSRTKLLNSKNVETLFEILSRFLFDQINERTFIAFSILPFLCFCDGVFKKSFAFEFHDWKFMNSSLRFSFGEIMLSDVTVMLISPWRLSFNIFIDFFIQTFNYLSKYWVGLEKIQELFPVLRWRLELHQ